MMIRNRRSFFLLLVQPALLAVYSAAWCADVSSAPPILRIKRAATLGDSRLRHAAQLTAIVPLSDGRRVLTCSQDNTLRLWELETGVEIRRFVHPDDCWFVAVRPGEKTGISTGGEKELIEWDFETGHEIRRFKGHEHTAFRCALNPGGTRMLSGAGGTEAFEWDLTGAGQVVNKHNVGGKDVSIYGVAWSRDGTSFALSGTHKQVCLFDASSGKCLRRFDGHTKTVFTIQFSPDGQRLVSSAEDKTVRLWNVADAKELWKVELPEESKISSFSPDGQRICVGVDDGSVRVLAAADGKEQLKIETEDRQIWPAVFTTDGTQILSGGACMLRRHDAATGQRLFPAADYDGPCTPIVAAVLEPRTGQLVLASQRDKTLFVMDPVNGRIVQRWPNEDRVSQLFRSADGLRVFGWGDKHLIAWDAATGKVLWSKALGDSFRALTCSRDGATVVLLDSRKFTTLSGETGDPIREISKGDQTYTNDVVVCPEGRLAACCQNDGVVILHQIPDLNEVGRLQLPVKPSKPKDAQNAGRISAEGSAGVQYVDVESGAILPKSGALLLVDNDKVLRQWRPAVEQVVRLTPEQIKKAVDDLTSEVFAARQEAIRKLGGCGEEILPLLDKVNAEDDQELGQTLRFLRQSMVTHRLPTRLQAQTLVFEHDLRKVTGHPDGMHWAALEGYGPKYVVFGHASSVGLALLDRIEDPNLPNDILFSADGRFLYTVNGNCTVSVYALNPAGPQ
jgi:WD40 repeat protein